MGLEDLNGVDMKNIKFIRFVNNNGFTYICGYCIIPNGECFDIAKQGRCKVYNDKQFKKLWKASRKDFR